jgi:hypothetical protein
MSHVKVNHNIVNWSHMWLANHIIVNWSHMWLANHIIFNWSHICHMCLVSYNIVIS